jgi:hypothetical protein
MFKRNKEQKFPGGRKWHATHIPPKKKHNEPRTFKYLETLGLERVFIEKNKDYDFHVVSRGTRPDNVKIVGIATNLKSAVILSNQEVTNINNNILGEQ